MKASSKNIQNYITKKELIKVRTTDEVAYYGIPLVSFDEGLVLLLITDFHIDGYIFIKRNYIKRILSLDTETYQNIIKKMGIVKKAMLTKYSNIKTRHDVLKSLKKKIITYNTRQYPEKWLFTKIVDFDEKFLKMLEFRSTGKWLKKPHKVNHSEIGFIQRSSEYLTAYEKYVFGHQK